MRRPHARSTPPGGGEGEATAPAEERPGWGTRGRAPMPTRNSEERRSLGGIRLRAAAPCGSLRPTHLNRRTRRVPSRFPIRAHQPRPTVVRTHEPGDYAILPFPRAPTTDIPSTKGASFLSHPLSLSCRGEETISRRRLPSCRYRGKPA